MRKTVLLCCAAVLTASAAPAEASKLPRREELRKYTTLYYTVKREEGKRAPGRNIRRYGVRTKAGEVRRATARDIARSIRTLRALRVDLLAPMPPSRPPSGALTARAPAGGTLARIAACESGGNPRAVSKSGLYRGKYQFLRSTWESVGGRGDPAAAPESEQDYRAALLYARSGPGQWPVCGR